MASTDLASIILPAMAPTPLILSPVHPSELLASIIQHETYPTTLIICATRAEFLQSLTDDIQNSATSTMTQPRDRDMLPAAATATTTTTTLLTNPLCQVAITRHIRMAFVPTVAHLRAYLSVFSPSDSPVPAPPSAAGEAGEQRRGNEAAPLLVVYGFLGLHRDTSEWSAQGLGATAAALVDAGRRCGFRAVVVDAPRAGLGARAREQADDEEALGADGCDEAGATVEEDVLDESGLAEEVPVLNASVVRAGGDLDDAVWTSRKVTLERVLGRWFKYGEGGLGERDKAGHMPILTDA